MKQRVEERQLLLLQSWKSDALMGSYREKSNIAFALLENVYNSIV